MINLITSFFRPENTEKEKKEKKEKYD